MWRGTWESRDADQRGELTLVLKPTGTQLEGDLALWQNLPSLRNDGAGVKGSVGATSVSFKLQSSDNPHVFSGEVSGETMTGTVLYFGRTGTWQATRLASTPLTSGRALTLPCWARTLSFGAGRLWSVCEEFIDLDPVTGAVHRWPRPDPADDRFRLSRCQSGAAWHDGKVWCTEGGPSLFVIDPAQGFEREVPLGAAERCQHPFFDGEHPWCVHQVTGEVRRFDSASAASLAVSGPWRSAQSVVRRGDELLVLLHYPDLLLRVGVADGALRGAYRFERASGVFTQALATDGTTVWLLSSTASDTRAIALEGL